MGSSGGGGWTTVGGPHRHVVLLHCQAVQGRQGRQGRRCQTQVSQPPVHRPAHPACSGGFVSFFI